MDSVQRGLLPVCYHLPDFRCGNSVFISLGSGNEINWNKGVYRNHNFLFHTRSRAFVCMEKRSFEMGLIKSMKDEDFGDNESLELLKKSGGNVFMTSIDSLLNWGRSNSVWPLTFATSCCGIEMMAAGASRHDFARFGIEVYRASPRQADVIVVAGTIVHKMVPVLKRLYDQMPEPKYVIAMGACAISGGPFFYNTYSVVRGVDHVIPVDVYIPGCPPRPEALLYGVMQLQRKIKGESVTNPGELPDIL